MMVSRGDILSSFFRIIGRTQQQTTKDDDENESHADANGHIPQAV